MAKRIIPGMLLLALILTGLACKLSVPGSSPLQPTGKIIYQSDRFGNTELFSFDVRNGQTLRLTNNTANDNHPSYIAPTRQIGFASDRQNGWNLFVMDNKGLHPKAITNQKDIGIEYPRWSADGKRITASMADPCTASVCDYDIYVLNADGTGMQNLTDSLSPEWVPEWSPDGQKIAFESDQGAGYEIYVMDQDGSNLERLTHNTGFDGFPRWSPDGSKFVFTTDREGLDWDIFIMDADGSDPRPVTNNKSGDFDASWSPDGNWLVYVSNNDGDNEIFIIDTHGQNQRRLTFNSANDTAPVWIP